MLMKRKHLDGRSRNVRRTFVRGATGATDSRHAARAIAIARARGLNAGTRGLQLARGEWKSVDTTISAMDVNTTGSLQLLNGMQQGAGIGNRVGAQILMRSIQFQGFSEAKITTGTEHQERVLIVYDRQANGAAPTFAQVLSATNAYAPRNLENRKRFKILYDRTFTVGNRTVASHADFGTVHRFYRKLRHPVEFNSGNAGTIADISSGSIYLLAYGSNAAGVTAGLLNGVVRIRFSDV